MDNAPTHTAIDINTFILENNVNHRKAPAKSPDLNPFEIVWNDLKLYLSTKCKPNTMEELIAGVTVLENCGYSRVEYCNSKINHVQNTVNHHVIREKGKATGI